MPEHEKPDPMRPDAEEATRRILDLMDADDVLYAVIECGDDDTYWYYIAIYEGHYEGRSYLKERYIQLVKPHAEAEREDTFKTNGINRRVEGTSVRFAAAMKQAYDRVHTVEKNIADGKESPEEVAPSYLTPATE